MTRTHFIKSCGYIVSTLSIALLGFVSWQNASRNPVLLVCLIAGMTLSAAGMAMRWWSYQMEER